MYDGYFIPKGSIILANAYAMLRNEEDYGPNPDAFNPERFLKDGKLNPDIREPSTMAFGFGRRYESPLNISFPVLSLKSSGNAQENHWLSQCSG